MNHITGANGAKPTDHGRETIWSLDSKPQVLRKGIERHHESPNQNRKNREINQIE